MRFVSPCLFSLVTSQDDLHSDGEGTDIRVSRDHFMLRAVSGGICLVKGVPQRGGGIRVPYNGTWLLAPERRPLGPAKNGFIRVPTPTMPPGSSRKFARAGSHGFGEKTRVYLNTSAPLRISSAIAGSACNATIETCVLSSSSSPA